MKQDNPDPMVHVAEFSDIGAKVTVPYQGRKIRVNKLPLDSPEQLKSDKDDFEPGRLVFNFEVRDDSTGELLTEFDPPFELRVAYTAQDHARAKAKQQDPVLGFWDGSRWIAFTTQKHNFRLEPVDKSKPELGGHGVVTLSKWADPPISWGP